MKKVIFFDIDDTLVDYSGTSKKTLRILRKKYFPKVNQKSFNQVWVEKTEENWKLFVEGKINFKQQRIRRIQSIWQNLGKDINPKEVDRVILTYVKLFEKNWKVLPGIKQNLKILKSNGVRLGIISNGHLDQQEAKLKQLGLYEFFDKELIIVSGKMGYAKPDLRLFKKAQQISGFGPKEIVFFGDSIINDYEPGKKMKWETVLVDSTRVIKKWILENV